MNASRKKRRQRRGSENSQMHKVLQLQETHRDGRTRPGLQRLQTSGELFDAPLLRQVFRPQLIYLHGFDLK